MTAPIRPDTGSGWFADFLAQELGPLDDTPPAVAADATAVQPASGESTTPPLRALRLALGGAAESLANTPADVLDVLASLPPAATQAPPPVGALAGTARVLAPYLVPAYRRAAEAVGDVLAGQPTNRSEETLRRDVGAVLSMLVPFPFIRARPSI